MKTPTLTEILVSPKLRVAYCRYDFLAFWTYYFAEDFVAPLAPFHLQWAHALSQTRDDILLIGFRGSLKTSEVLAYLVYCAVYALEEYVVVQSYEQTNSTNLTTMVAQGLLSPRIVADFGTLYPLERKRDDLTKKSVSNFTTTNGVRFQARSLNATVRGPVTRKPGGKIERPTLLVGDDIDVLASVSNQRIIDKNELLLRNQTIGSMSINRRRVIILWNVIKEDGIIPRLEKSWKARSGARVFRQALLNIEGVCCWKEYFTTEKIQQLKDEGSLTFAQNYLLIPSTDGAKLINRADIRLIDKPPDQLGRVVVGIDPAFSEKKRSDAMGVTISGNEPLPMASEDTKQRFRRTALESIPFEGKDKNEVAFVRAMVALNTRYHPSLFRVEGNNGGEILARMLKDAGLPVEVVYQHKDKETRVRDRQGEFERWQVSFLIGKTEKLYDQLLDFPTVGVHDDLVDSMLLSFCDDLANREFYVI